MRLSLQTLSLVRQDGGAINLISNGQVGSLVTFDRNDDETFYDSSGTRQTAGTDEQAISHVYGFPALNVYETSENKIINNSVAVFNSTSTITTGVTGISGGSTGKRITETLATNYHAITDSASQVYTNNVAHTISVEVNPETCDKVQLLVSSAVSSTAWVNYDLTGEGSVTRSGGGEDNSGIFKLPNGWYVIYMTLTGNGGTGQSFLGLLATGQETRLQTITSASRTLVIDQWMMETELGPTPMIPTTSSVQSRTNIDTVRIDGTNFSDLYNQSAMTIMVDWADPVGSRSINAALLSISDGSSSNRVEIITGTQRLPRVTSGGTTTVSTNSTNVYQGNNVDLIKWDGTTFKYYINGELEVEDTSATLPSSVDRMLIGSSSTGASSPINGGIRAVKVWQKELSDEQAAVLSARYVDYVTEGDSYMAGSSGIGINASLRDLGHVIASGAQGGDTLSGIQNDVTGQTTDTTAYYLRNAKKLILCDGSVNGNSGVVATEVAKYQAMYDTFNGNIIIVSPMLYSQLATSDLTNAQFTLDLTAALITEFGSSIVVDATAVARTESGASFTDVTDANDAGYTDSAYDALFQADNIHMDQDLSDALTAEILTKV